ncbi:MAG: hypothetical protein ACKO2K_10930 [Alphaproteobacteria bacterium]
MARGLQSTLDMMNTDKQPKDRRLLASGSRIRGIWQIRVRGLSDPFSKDGERAAFGRKADPARRPAPSR